MGDVTFLHDANGLVLDVARPRARPDDRRRQRRRRLDLRDAGAGGAGARRPLRPALRHPARRRPRQPVRRDPHAALAGRVAARARAGAGLAQRRHRGRRGSGPPRQPARARRAHPAARATTDQAAAPDGRHTMERMVSNDDRRRGTRSSSFVDTLAEVLDDHDATRRRAGARLHFSRFHFDRMIKSVAGEPPAAFRRRILLERAAYRMITTSAPLIDIAVEAGYGSHEAFTRAFKQAYGATPAGLAQEARPPPDRGAQRRPLPPTRQPPAARTRRGHCHGAPHEDGRAPRLAHRRDGPPRRAPHRRAARRGDRARRRRRPAVHPLAAHPAGRPDGHVERRDGDPRLRLVGRGARVAELDARAARGRGPDVPRPRPRRRRRRPPRRHLRRRALRARRGVHLRRDDRPRAHLRRPPAHPRRARLRQARRRGARLGRPDALGRRTWVVARFEASCSACGIETSPCDSARHAIEAQALAAAHLDQRSSDTMAAWRSRSCSSPWPCPCSRSRRWPTGWTSRRRCC